MLEANGNDRDKKSPYHNDFQETLFLTLKLTLVLNTLSKHVT